ncbi:MAG: hypothetical protein AAF960_17140 [Bacteroidota bacterium]
MRKQQTDHLIQLIASLTKAEKRHFRLFVTRNQSSNDLLFLQLFEMIDKYQDYDEELILKRIPQIKKRQLSNLKAHLYKQLLLSLRLLSRTYNADIEIRERIDYAKVLYNKGLYRQSLEMLDKAKGLATKYRQNVLILEIVEFEKLIESQYITRSINTRAEELTREAYDLAQRALRTQRLSNVALQLYGLYLRIGFVRNEKDHYFVKEFFHSSLPKYNVEDLGFYEKLYLYQSHVWYNHTTQDFLHCYKYAQKWVDLFHESPEMQQVDPAIYIKGLHNLLSALFYLSHYTRFVEVLKELENFKLNEKNSRIKNLESIFYLFRYIHKINLHYIEGTFDEGTRLVPELVDIIDSKKYHWDNHRIMVFHYRIACLYFSSGDNDTAIHYLNLILNAPNPQIREDIQCFARFLNLMAHYELGHTQLLEYLVKSVYRFLAKMQELHQAQKEILTFLRRLHRIQRKNGLKKEFIKLKSNLEKIQDDPYERRPFLYLDIISWLESKIENKPVQTVIREKFLKKRLSLTGR